MYEDIFLDVPATLVAWGQSYRDEPFYLGIWEDRFWMNTPGPLHYIGGSYETKDLLIAPNNIAIDDEGFLVIYRQPVNRYELQQVMQAAKSTHRCVADGDVQWSYKAIKEWWTESRPLAENKVRQAYEQELAAEQHHYEDAIYLSGLRRWSEYFTEGMYQYLQVYAFFLDNERVPTESDRLPEL